MSQAEITTTKPWTVTVQPAPAHSSHQGPLYRVKGPELAAPHDTKEGIILSNKEHAHVLATSQELLLELANVLDFYEYVDALSPEIIAMAQATINKAKGITPRKCGTPGCPNTPLKDSIQIGPGTNIYVCCTCAEVI